MRESVDSFPNYLQLLLQIALLMSENEYIKLPSRLQVLNLGGGGGISIPSEINWSWRDLRALKNQVVGITSGIQNQDLHLLEVLTVFPFLPSSSSLCAEKSSTWAVRPRFGYEENASASRCRENVDELACLEYFEISGLHSHKTDMELGLLTF